MNIKPAVNTPVPIYKNIEVIQNDIVILDSKNYSELIKNIINYSKYAGGISINYNPEKRKYYLKDKNSKQAGDWDTLFSKSTDKYDCWFLLDTLFNIITYKVIDYNLLIYIK